MLLNILSPIATVALADEITTTKSAEAAPSPESSETPTPSAEPSLTISLDPSPTASPSESSVPAPEPIVEPSPTPFPTPSLDESLTTPPALELELIDTSSTESQSSATLAPPIWQTNSDGSSTTINSVILNQTYTATQNDKVSVTFTKLSANSGKLTIKEITLTSEQMAKTGALSDKAYDITSDMADGTFAFDLILPKPTNQENAQIKFAEDVAGLKNAETVASGDVKTETASVSTSLNHFTIFVVAGTISSPGPGTYIASPFNEASASVVINEFVYNPSTGNEWVEIINKTNSDIDLTGWKIEDFANHQSTLSGILPANGIKVFDNLGTVSLNNTTSDGNGDTIYLKNGSDTIIDEVTYQKQADGTTINNTSSVASVAAGQSLYRTTDGGSSWDVTSSPSKGWFNIATTWTCDQLNGTGSPATPPILASIAACLSSGSGIVTNMGSLTNPSAATDLSFEKRTNVADSATAVGKIVFAGPLNLSDQNTVNYLKAAGQKLDMATSGGEVRVGLDTIVSGATESNFKTAAATITMYGLSAIHSAPNLLIKNNSGAAILPSDAANYPTVTGVGGVAGFNDTLHTYTFTTNHFTTFETDSISPTVTKLGTNSADVTITAGATATLVFSEPLSSTGKSAVETALTNGANQTITYSWNGASDTLTITGHVSNLTTFANDVVVNVSDVAGNTSSGLLIVDSKLDATQTTPNGSGAATVDSTTPQVVITNPTQAVDLTISSGTTSPTIDVSSFITNGTGTLPAITITSANANNTSVAIPASTVVTSADATWNGIIAAPTVTTVTLPDTSGQTKTLSTAIEVGFTDAKLSFDKAVRLLLPNQAGKRAGYIRTGIDFTEITNICAADNQTTGDALAADGECKIDAANGLDLVIWTKHFTKFASYTQTTNPPAGSGLSDGLGCANHDCNTATTSQAQISGSAQKFISEVLGTLTTPSLENTSSPSEDSVKGASTSPKPTSVEEQSGNKKGLAVALGVLILASGTAFFLRKRIF